MYYKIESYIDDSEYVITAKVPMGGLSGTEVSGTEFVGTIHLPARTPQGIVQVPIEFDFPKGLTITQCFEKFEEMATAEIAKLKKEQEERNRIIPATSIPSMKPPEIKI